ncbi:MAG: Holliday junction resolvase RuvX [Verrucomicrobiae bacterium]|nr:Holliday junction resolvase RuvX [Verrucomicrobiae bacterium]NNJ42550.1 Holliday junction resolvase RuvX [Akkermansiaceae bacterium]
MTTEHPVLAIDHGDARIGIAATDPIGIMAHPVETIHVKTTDPIERIAELVQQRQVKQLVLGLPLRLDGSEGAAAIKIRRFGKQLKERLPDLPLHLCDETLTTVAAADKLHQAGKNAKRQKSIIDQAAAVEILNNWLEFS